MNSVETKPDSEQDQSGCCHWQSVIEYVRPASRAQWIVMFAIVILLAALLVSATRWVADGMIEVPVRVFVFDPSDMSPIADVAVVVFRAPPMSGEPSLDEFRERFPMEVLSHDVDRQTTGVDGIANINIRFSTVASDRNPESRVHTDWYWVMAGAEGYGTAIVPLRYSATPTKSLRKRGELPVSIGLLPISQ